MIGLVTFCCQGQTVGGTPHPALTLRCHDIDPCTARETPTDNSMESGSLDGEEEELFRYTYEFWIDCSLPFRTLFHN